MNSTNKAALVSGLASLVTGFFAWESREFWLLTLTVVGLSISLGALFSRIRQTMTISASLFAALTVAELALSLLPEAPTGESALFDPSSSYAQGGYFDVFPGNSLGYTIEPGIYDAKKITSSGEVIYEVEYEIGQDGYRSDLSDYEQDYRAFLFGGSFAFGEGLDRDGTLAHHMTDLGLVSKNLGVHGYGMHQSLLQLKMNLGATVPGQVNIALTAPWHAFRSSCLVDQSAGSILFQERNGLAVEEGVCPGGGIIQRVLGRSEIFALMRQTFEGQKILADKDILRYLAIIRSMQEISHEQGVEFVVAFIDAEQEVLEGTGWSNQEIKQELENSGVSLVDVSLSPPSEFTIHSLDSHPNSDANKLRAELITKYLRATAN